MDAIEVLLNRVSQAKLIAPAPSSEELDLLIKMAVRAPDHGALKPWRFLVIEEERLTALSDLFLKVASQSGETSAGVLEKVKNMPFRAPMIIVPIVKVTPNHKVPVIEQQLAGAAASQNILLGLYALGYGGIWRTGDMAYNTTVHDELGLGETEQVLGFLYVGTPSAPASPPPELSPKDFYVYW